MMSGGEGGGGLDMGSLIAGQMIQAAKLVEEQIDQEMEKMDKLDEDDLEALKAKRLRALKRQQEKKQEWLQKGHGQYEEIPEEKAFFDVTKGSENVVVHFYRDETFRCKIVDKHLAILAPKHIETKFCKINADKCPFLTQRLRIKVIPTMALIKDAKTRDYIIGFTDLGNTDEFSTEMLEWRLAQSEIIHYSGDLMTPPDGSRGPGGGGAAAKKAISVLGKPKAKTIRGSAKDDDDSDEDDWHN